jgi:hypothetical protein
MKMNENVYKRMVDAGIAETEDAEIEYDAVLLSHYNLPSLTFCWLQIKQIAIRTN